MSGKGKTKITDDQIIVLTLWRLILAEEKQWADPKGWPISLYNSSYIRGRIDAIRLTKDRFLSTFGGLYNLPDV